MVAQVKAGASAKPARQLGPVTLWVLAILGAAALITAGSMVDWTSSAGWWVGAPMLGAGLWSFVAFHASPVRSRQPESPARPVGALRALVLVSQDTPDSPERVLSTVASLDADTHVTLVGGADAEFLASAMGVDHSETGLLPTLVAGFEPTDVVFPIVAGTLVDSRSVRQAMATLADSGASWCSALPAFDDADAYLPPGPRVSTAWWVGNALAASSRVWVSSSTLVRADLLATTSARTGSTTLAGAPAGAFGVVAPSGFTLLLPPYEAEEFFATRLADLRSGIRDAVRAVVSRGAAMPGRVSAFALMLRLARGVPMFFAATVPAVLALTGASVTAVPEVSWLALLAAPVLIRTLLLAPDTSVRGLAGTLAAAIYEFPISLVATVTALRRQSHPSDAKVAPQVLLTLMIGSALCVVAGEVISHVAGMAPEQDANRVAGAVGVLAFVAASTWAVFRCSRVKRSGRASVRFATDAAATLGGVPARLVDVSLGGALALVRTGELVPGPAGAMVLDVEGGPSGISAFMVRSVTDGTDDRVSVTTSGDRAAQVRWASWVLERSGLLPGQLPGRDHSQ